MTIICFYSSCVLSDRDILMSTIISCIGDVAQLMVSKWLKLNPSNSEFLWWAMALCLHPVEHSTLHLSDGNVTPSSSVGNLGTYFNESMDMSSHVNMLVSSSFYQLSRVRAIPHLIPTSMAIQLINSFMTSRVDYCNSLLLGLPACQVEHIQSFLNYTARIIYGRRKYDHVMPFLKDKRHWLHIPQRVMLLVGIQVLQMVGYHALDDDDMATNLPLQPPLHIDRWSCSSSCTLPYVTPQCCDVVCTLAARSQMTVSAVLDNRMSLSFPEVAARRVISWKLYPTCGWCFSSGTHVFWPQHLAHGPLITY